MTEEPVQRDIDRVIEVLERLRRSDRPALSSLGREDAALLRDPDGYPSRDIAIVIRDLDALPYLTDPGTLGGLSVTTLERVQDYLRQYLRERPVLLPPKP